MRIKGTEHISRQIEVDVSAQDCANHLSRYILRSLGLNSNMSLKDGQIIESEEHHTSHSWSTEKVRFESPTNEQITALKLVTELQHQVYAAVDRTLKKL